MAYHLQQQQRTGSNDANWLALLVQTFETVSRDGGRPDPATIAGLTAQLARPAAALAARSSSLH